MKTKMSSVVGRVQETEERTKSLEAQVDRLTAENIKLTADMKILRDEHTEVLHNLFIFERKNNSLLHENNTLK